MGYALAEAAKDLKMEVYLISGPVNLPCPEGVKLYKVETADEMLEKMEANFEFADLVIMSAAVSDHKPHTRHNQKLRKDEMPRKIILERNPDILKTLSSKKKNKIVVGFAAETHEVMKSAKRKLKEKNLDWIVANDVSQQGIGFSAEYNEVILIGADGTEKQFPLTEKAIIAKEILKIIYPLCLEKAL